MLRNKVFRVFFLLLFYAGTSFGAAVILNEYNAVSASNYLNGGTATQDVDGGYASDSYFGRILGNGGDWFELVVIQDHLDMRNWKFVISDMYSRSTPEVLRLKDNSIWSDLRSGTIITISEDLPDDVSYDPLHGDWWINVQANAGGSGLYIEKQDFPVNKDDWQLTIMKADNTAMFGPAGEGVIPDGPGVSGTEIFRLEANPSSSITPLSNYNDGRTLSTFGMPNRWPGGEVQDFSQLRGVNTITGYIKNSCDVPIEGVAVDANNGGGSDTTDLNGYYEVWVDYNWSGTVTPAKDNYTFSPTSMVYLNVLDDVMDQNYQAFNIYDLDCDGSIGYGDVYMISINWLDNTVGNICDFNADNIVNFLDFAELALVW
jgi:hypothetical protein